MKEQDQVRAVRAIAELDGEYASRLTSNPLTAPDYLTSYDAIIPVIQKQPVEIKRKMDKYLELISFEYGLPTVPQLCEALLRASGKWIE